MRFAPFIISTVATTALVICLNKRWGAIPAMGEFLSPQHGFWQNAEATDYDFSASLQLPGLKGNASVYFDERLVPHVFADNETDAYFIQGYLHAKFRLFQMDLQTKAAEGRASEIAGERAVNYDREQRRLGMRYAAENSLKALESDPAMKAVYDAYTAGVNAYIDNMKICELPLEYKLLGFAPERWSNMRTALLLKMMAKMLASGTESDLAYTSAKSVFSKEEMNMLYPQVPDSLKPIVPQGTSFAPPGMVPVAPSTADSLYFAKSTIAVANEVSRPDPDNGSNNWVVAGKKTASGAPILCNDPHLELSLPSIWYEMQITTPASNAYGVTLPGSPFVIVGFNDDIAWGVTNAQRDVKDYYEIRFHNSSKKEYWFNNAWTPTQLRPEEIKVRGGGTVYDTVAYTIFGPVLYDQSFPDGSVQHHNLAIRWAAHDGNDDGATFYRLNRAKNYDDYTAAISTFTCPGQNFVFASKGGDIALWQQGKFPARWNGQGLYVMPGEDSSYMWQGFIAQQENPHSENPEQGFLQSANQRPADSTYPYFIPGSYITPRGITIYRQLSQMNGITTQDMMKLQNNYYNVQAEYACPILLRYTRQEGLSPEEMKYMNMIMNWDYTAGPSSKGQTVFACWWDSLEIEIWKDDISQTTSWLPMPDMETTIELLKKDSAMRFVDNINTPGVENLYDDVTAALKKAARQLAKTETEGRLEWAKFKEPGIYHLLDTKKTDLLPFDRTKLNVGGDGNIINAITKSHGPSWRMIVQLSALTEAYGVYPGGQSGNPGSRYYDNFIDQWVRGQYYPLWVMKKSDGIDKKVKWTMKFTPAS